MVYRQKLTKIGNSVGVVLPKTLRVGLKLDLKKEIYLEDDLESGTIVISTKLKNKISGKVSHDFYNLMKSVTNKYSSALKELADK